VRGRGACICQPPARAHDHPPIGSRWRAARDSARSCAPAPPHGDQVARAARGVGWRISHVCSFDFASSACTSPRTSRWTVSSGARSRQVRLRISAPSNAAMTNMPSSSARTASTPAAWNAPARAFRQRSNAASAASRRSGPSSEDSTATATTGQPPGSRCAAGPGAGRSLQHQSPPTAPRLQRARIEVLAGRALVIARSRAVVRGDGGERGWGQWGAGAVVGRGG
jgi:hypothetical protein